MPAFVDSASQREWQAVFSLLDTALDLDPDERARWLQALPIEQARLTPMLKALLQAHAEVGTGDFMHTPAYMVLPAASTPPESPEPPEPAQGLAAQTLVGPYRLIREIGQGGMASVWLATRADGLLERQIALKLPHITWGIAQFADRMARERNILGSLTHQNIARLYDAGIAADGRPFLALEYVDGQTIDAYAAAAGLSVRARVGLIVQVARAVAHAHARLVVHRDLKPSNILVDAAGQTHLLDFGIAKIVDPQFDELSEEGSPLTQGAGRALTPDYASPEQIRGDAIGTASDIYSLGVVMFELLVGTRPYRLQPGLGAAALAEEVARAEVPRASVAAGGEALRRQLAGDLDAILAKAMAKVSNERYATIDALADDLERYLRGQPVQARRASNWYFAERWVRRHRSESAVAAVLLLAVLGGAYAQALAVLALAAGALLALWQRNRALRQAELARAARDRAEQVKHFIASIFTQAVPRAGHGGAVTAADLLQAAARRVESDLVGQPEVAAELAALIGASFNELGDVRAGLDWLPKVVERCTRAFGPTHPISLESRWRLVEAANSIGELSVSEPLLPALLSDLRSVQPRQTELFLAALKSHAFVQTKRGHETAAMAALDEAVETATLRLGAGSEGALLARAALSNTCSHFGRTAQALAAIEPALAPAHSAFGAQRPHTLLVVIERAHADALARHNRPRDAAILLRQVLNDQQALDVDDTTRVRILLTMLSNTLMLGGHFDEALSLIEQAGALHERLTGGVNDEGIGLAGKHSLICALRGDGAGAMRALARADAMAAASGEAFAQAFDLIPLRALSLATAGQSTQALACADALHPDRFAALLGSGRVRLLRARALALRQIGSPAQACVAAEQALTVAAESACNALEHGLVLAEAARCNRAAGAAEKAAQQWQAAFAVWDAGQVDGPEFLTPLRAEFAALSLAA